MTFFDKRSLKKQPTHISIVLLVLPLIVTFCFFYIFLPFLCIVHLVYGENNKLSHKVCIVIYIYSTKGDGATHTHMQVIKTKSPLNGMLHLSCVSYTC